MRFAKVASLGIAAVLAVACGGLTIPSIPAIPSFPIPSFGLPSGQTLPPGVIPSASGTCVFMTAAEVSSIWGSPATLTSTDNGDCDFTFGNFSTISISVENSTDLSGARIIFGNTAKDITVGGLPGISGAIFGQAAMYIQKGANQLQLLGILTGTDDATMAKLVQVATLAVSRWQ
jgi:hypothetical protein